MRGIATLLLTFCIIGSAFALYGANSKVVMLTKSTFNSLVLNSKEIWLVEFFGNFIMNFI